MRRILLFPSIKKEWGLGHLVRCARLLGSLGEDCGIYAPKDDTPQEWGWASLEKKMEGFIPAGAVRHEFRAEDWDLLVFDRRETAPAFFSIFAQGLPSLGIDEGGRCRRLFTYLLDTFPRLSRTDPPNVRDEGFLGEDVPAGAPRRPRNIEKVLLSFGGEDPKDLTEIVFDALVKTGRLAESSIDVVVGPAFAVDFTKPCGRVFRGLKTLAPLYPNYDLVLTSFGITAYEALKAGAAVVLANPTGYHEKLSRKAGIPTLGVCRTLDAAFLAAAIEEPEKHLYPALDKLVIERRGIAEFITALDFPPSSGCPACGNRGNGAVHRFEDKTYFRCGKCRTPYLEYFGGKRQAYDEGYFFDDYRRQYGKTYLEDFEAIKTLADGRLKAAASLAGGLSGKTLLDVGCAYGPFLKAAAERGARPFGLDVAEPAVAYVKDTLGLAAAKGDFLTFDSEAVFGIKSFDIVTLWYVIEHFRDLAGALEKAAGLLAPGGILAFSTPNGRGVSALRDPSSFFKNSPSDHYTVLDPAGAIRLMKDFGLKPKKLRITGHHPERFPAALKRIAGPGLLGSMSRFLGLGDTFELYAVKTSKKERDL